MPDFSTILQTPEIRSLVQENILERAFHDSLFPRMLFRGEAAPVIWPANVGDTMVFSGTGLIAPKMAPLTPGTDPTPSTFPAEQWTAQLQQYADSIDTHMPTSIAAIANLFLRNAQQLGLSAAQALNRIVRNRLYNAALSGNTVADVAGTASTSMHVLRLNGFTTARRPDLAAGSQVQFSPISASNPLSATLYNAGGPTTVSITAFTPDNAGDVTGPGTLTLAAAATWTARNALVASDASTINRVGGGNSIDSLVAADTLTLAAIRSTVANFWQNNVPEMPDGRFHCHLDPTAQGEVFGDPEFQRLLTALPDYFVYKQFALGELLNTVFFRNSEAPVPQTVAGWSTDGYSTSDPLGAEAFTGGSSSGIEVHRSLFVGQGGLLEYYQELSQLITEAGVTGRVGAPKITNNGIEVFSDRIQLIVRAPLNRLQDKVATSWKFIGDWPFRTDVTTGDGTRYKRARVIESA